jgi:tetratricopeptide (TPR) repeat protein
MHSKSSPLTHTKKTALFLSAVLLALLTAAVYWQVLSFDFIGYDDDTYVTQNYQIQEGFTPAAIKWAITTRHAGFWQPLVWLTFMLDFHLYGVDSGGFHATNLALHIVNSLLLFLFLHLATQTVGRSWFVAFLFALHPLHVESVAWVAERKDVLSTMFLMLALLGYFWYTRKPSLQKYLLTLLSFILGLSAKAMLVSLPLLLLFLDFWPLQRFPPAPPGEKATTPSQKTISFLLAEKIPFFLIALLFSIVTVLTQKSGGAVVSQVIHPLAMRGANGLISYLVYIKKMFVPLDLAVLYPFPATIPAGRALAAGLILLAISWAAFTVRYKKPYILFGWLWYGISIFPVIGLVQVGPQAMADRFTYIPMIGLFITCVWGFHEMAHFFRYRKFLLTGLSLLVILFLSVLCWRQIAYWKDSFTLFSHTISVTENNYVAHTMLGNIYSARGDLPEAAGHFIKALEIAPGYKSAHMGYGITLAKMKNLPAAESHLLEALSLDPASVSAHYNLGLLFYKQQRIAEAVHHFTRVLELQPLHPKAHFYFGNILAEQGNFSDAVAHYRRALTVLPNDRRIQNNLKRAAADLRKVE